jgi:hypothetical protein
MPVIVPPTPADRVYSRLEPIAHGDEEAGYPLYGLVEALTSPQDPLEEIVREDDTHPAWARAVDPYEAPLWVLPWLAALVGVEWAAEPSEALRTKIIERPNYRRGTVPAIRSAVQATLTGTKTVRIAARVNDSPWRMTVITSPGETPDSAWTLSALLTEKPAGIVQTFITDDDAIIDEGEATIDAVPDAVTIDTVTIGDID